MTRRESLNAWGTGGFSHAVLCRGSRPRSAPRRLRRRWTRGGNPRSAVFRDHAVWLPYGLDAARGTAASGTTATGHGRRGLLSRHRHPDRLAWSGFRALQKARARPLELHLAANRTILSERVARLSGVRAPRLPGRVDVQRAVAGWRPFARVVGSNATPGARAEEELPRAGPAFRDFRVLDFRRQE